MNARELHDLYTRNGVEVIDESRDGPTILRALDLLARTEESTDELVRELLSIAEVITSRPVLQHWPHMMADKDHATVKKAAAAIVALNENCAMLKRTVENQDAYIVALKAERDSLKAHAEALHDKLGRFLEFFHGYQSMEWKDSHEVYDAYRAAFPKDAP